MEQKRDLAYLHSFISIFIMVGAYLLPDIGMIPSMGITILGAFAGAIYGWCTVSMIWPSILALLMLGLSGYTTVLGAFQAAASNGTVLMVLFLMAFSSILQVAGINQRIAIWLISRNFVKGKPWALSFMILLASWISAMFVGLTPPILIAWAILYNIADEVGIEPGDKWMSLMCFGVVFVSTLGVNAVPFQVGVIANFGFMSAATDGAYVLDFSQYLIFACLMSFLMILLFIGMCKYVFKINVNKLENYVAKPDAVEPMNSYAKKAVVLFVILILALMLPCVLPQGNSVRILLEQTLGGTACCVLMIAVALIIRHEGKPFVEFNKLVFQGVSWDVIFMLAAAFTISSAVTSDAVGIAPALQASIGPFFNGNNVYIFLGSLLLVALVATNFINNVVVSAIMVPLSCKMAMSTGIVSPIILCALYMMVIDLGFLLPSSSVGGAMIHGNLKWVSKKDLYTYCMIFIIFTGVICLLIGYPLAKLIFK